MRWHGRLPTCEIAQKEVRCIPARGSRELKHLAHLALYLVKCSGLFSRAGLLVQTPSRARRQRVLALALRPTTRPPRCFVRVVGLRGWCGMERRARDAADRQTTGTNGREVPRIRLESQSQGRSQRQRQRQRTTRQGCRAGRAASMAKTKRISRPGQKSRGEGW